jgi:hypothetical protein
VCLPRSGVWACILFCLASVAVSLVVVRGFAPILVSIYVLRLRPLPVQLYTLSVYVSRRSVDYCLYSALGVGCAVRVPRACSPSVRPYGSRVRSYSYSVVLSCGCPSDVSVDRGPETS